LAQAKDRNTTIRKNSYISELQWKGSLLSIMGTSVDRLEGLSTEYVERVW
jgi:hypothetical protein